METFSETVDRLQKHHNRGRATIYLVLSMKCGSDTPRLMGTVNNWSSMEEHLTSNRLAVDQPTRGADRNRTLADQADPATDEMLLPSLDDGITLLDVEGSRGVPIL